MSQDGTLSFPDGGEVQVAMGLFGEGVNMSPLKVILADNHPAVRKNLRLLLESERDIEVIAETNDGLETIRAVQALQPDLLVLDIKMPLMSGLEVLQYLRNEKHPMGILILSNHTEQLYVAAALRLGADAFLTKSAGVEVLLEAIRIVQQRVSGDRVERSARALVSTSGRGGLFWSESWVDPDYSGMNAIPAEKSA